MMNHTLTTHSLCTAFALAAAALIVFLPLPAPAQSLDLQQFQPIAEQQQNYLFSPSTQISPHGQWSAFGALSLSSNPLVLRDTDGERTTSLVSSQVKFHLLGAFSIYDQLEINVDIPLYLHQGVESDLPPGVSGVDSRRGIGDVRLTPKYQFYSSDEDNSDEEIEWVIAALLDTHVPTGNGTYLQGRDFRIGPTVVAEALFSAGHRASVHLGYQFRPSNQMRNLVIDDTIGWGIAGEFAVDDDIGIVGELMGKLTASAGFDGAHSPTEFVTGVKADIDPVYVTGGFGLGIIRGYGTPDWRTFVSVGIPVPPQTTEELDITAPPAPRPDGNAEPESDDDR